MLTTITLGLPQSPFLSQRPGTRGRPTLPISARARAPVGSCTQCPRPGLAVLHFRASVNISCVAPSSLSLLLQVTPPGGASGDVFFPSHEGLILNSSPPGAGPPPNSGQEESILTLSFTLGSSSSLSQSCPETRSKSESASTWQEALRLQSTEAGQQCQDTDIISHRFKPLDPAVPEVSTQTENWV